MSASERRATTVHLVPGFRPATGYDAVHEDFEALVRSARATGASAYALCDDPEGADLILFVGTRERLQRDVRRHALLRRHRERSFVYDASDRVIPFLPGIYPSIERRYLDAARTCGGFYLRHLDADWIEWQPRVAAARHLYSFVGAACNHHVRRELMQLRGARGQLVDTTDAPARGGGQSAAAYAAFHRSYAAALADTKFVLCPRGVGASSMRVFEAMRAGRAPVIVSDQWVAPRGPDWETFSLRVAEADLGTLVARLEALEERAPEMGARARAAWQAWFSPAAAFATMARWCVEFPARGRLRRRLDTLTAGVQLLRPHHLRHDLAAALRDAIAGPPAPARAQDGKASS